MKYVERYFIHVSKDQLDFINETFNFTGQSMVNFYQCYNFSDWENAKIEQGGRFLENKRKLCKKHSHYVFSQGDNKKAPGCGTCLCCQPGILH